jgi:bifunctional non-homologous end joining protein LigD
MRCSLPCHSREWSAVASKAPPRLSKGIPTTGLPQFVEPQLAQLRKEAPVGERWVHEIKLDSYRIHARIDGKDVRLLTRTVLDWTDRYRATEAALRKLKVKQAYLDGELCALDANGLTSSAAMQSATDHRPSEGLVYFVFDMLHLDGEDVKRLPLIERKAKLQRLLARAPAGLRYSEHFTQPGPDVLAAAYRIGAEGIVSKRIHTSTRRLFGCRGRRLERSGRRLRR